MQRCHIPPLCILGMFIFLYAEYLSFIWRSSSFKNSTCLYDLWIGTYQPTQTLCLHCKYDRGHAHAVAATCAHRTPCYTDTVMHCTTSMYASACQRPGNGRYIHLCLTNNPSLLFSRSVLIKHISL